MNEISKIIAEGETKFAEFKREYSPSLLKTVSAFANFHDGKIIIGISDELEILGIQNISQTSINIENAIHDNIAPKPFYEILTKQFDDKKLLIIKVYKGEFTPYYFKNKAYMRSDTATVEVDRYSLNKLILEGQNYDFETLDAKNQDTLSFNYLEKKLRSIKKISILTVDILKSLELVRNEKYTNAAALLSDYNPLENSEFILIKYSAEKMNIDDKLELKQVSILEQFDRSIDFFQKHISISERIEGAYRQTFEEIPLVAYREAISNAIVHRDYMAKGAIKVECFSNKIEITSPGGLPSNISEQEYLEGRLSVMRNRVVADIFLRLNIIEKLATAIRRIKEYYAQSLSQPIFDVKENSIRVILPKQMRKTYIAQESQAYQPTHSLSDKENKIMEYISKYGEISRQSAEELLNIHKTQTIKIINNLLNKNLIYKTSKGKNIRYHTSERKE